MTSSLATYTADFGSTYGSIAFQQFPGYARMVQNLDLTTLSAGDCTAFSYHLHETNGALTAASETECAQTNGHFIPNRQCSSVASFGDQETYEIGDLSGRFGNINATGTWSVSEVFPELIVSSLENRGITLHCVASGDQNGVRKLCAPLVASNETVANEDRPATVGAYHAYFGAGTHDNWFQGYVKIQDGKVETKFVNAAAICDAPMAFHVHSAWPAEVDSGLHYTTNSTQCGATKKHYDPFLACGPASEYSAREECNCSTTIADYGSRCTGDFPREGYGCEVGDLSGRFGKVANSTGEVTATNTLNVMPPAGLTTYAVTFHCGTARVLCGKLLECPAGGCVQPTLPAAPTAPSPSPTPEDDSSAPILAGSALLALLAWF